MSSTKFSNEAGFDLRSLPRLFEVKSTSKKNKSAYELIMKHYILRQDPAGGKKLLQEKEYATFWKAMPIRVFDESFVSLAKSLYPPMKLMGQLN